MTTPARQPESQHVKPTALIAIAVCSALALLTLIGTIYVTTSGTYNLVPTVLGAGLTLAFAFGAWVAWHDGRRT